MSIVLTEVQGVEKINLYNIYKTPEKETGIVSHRLALFFTASWSLSSYSWAQMLCQLKKELNSLEDNFLQVFVIPAEINENDEEGFGALAKACEGYHVPLKDKYLLEQIFKQFPIKEFPQIYVLDEEGYLVTNSGVQDMLKMDV